MRHQDERSARLTRSSPGAWTAVLLIPALLGFLGGPNDAGAAPANVDKAFLEAHVPEIQLLSEATLESPVTPMTAVEGIRQILDARLTALLELNEKTPLTTFDGIETQDRFDRKVVFEVNRVAEAGVAADTTLAPPEDALRYAEYTTNIPPLGSTPVGFMILAQAEIAITIADSLAGASTLSELSASKLALRLIANGTRRSYVVSGDLTASDGYANFRFNSVVVRLRCPKDLGTYRINRMQNKLASNGNMSRIYFLQCNICGAPQSLQFPLELQSRIQQISETQKLKSKPTPTRPSQGLDP